MRLCVVSGTFHPEPGGPPTFLYHLLPQLQERGHTIRVVTYGEAGAPDDYGYPVTRVSRRPPIPLRLLAFAREVLRAGRRADLFFVSDYGLPVAVINILLGKPIVLRLVADFAWEFSQRRGWVPPSQSVEEFQTARHSLRVRFLRGLQCWYTRAARQVIVPSEHVARLARGWGLQPRVIYNAVDPAPFALGRRAKPDAPVVVTVARLTPVKGVDVVIRALALVRQAQPHASLIVVGDGDARPALEQLCRELGLASAVRFAGTLPLERVAETLCSASVFALGSRTEGLPHAALEAMTAGTPVVATRVGGTPEVVADGLNGLLVPPDDPAAMATAINQVLNDPELAGRLTQAARATLERFSWPRLVDDYDLALRAALS